MTAMWGIHNDTLTSELVTDGFVSVGWGPVPDLDGLGVTREEIKASLATIYPDRSAATIAAWAGILLRFRDEIQIGDVIVAPYKPDRTVNVGIITSGYYYDAAAPEHRHRRRVEWKRVGTPRVDLTPAGRDALSRLQTVFAIRTATAEFAGLLNGATATLDDPHVTVPAPTPVEPVDEIRASRVLEHTNDFVLERLLRGIDHREFEEFVADLLRAIGYRARTTPYSNDGGIDVIAHKDALGVEPHLIKVQCKHTVATVGRPTVQGLTGALGTGELGVLVTLGGYSAEALAEERTKPQLRLLGGEDVVHLVLEHYSALAERWRRLIPLTPVLVVDDAADA